jgi:hypothetical protein
MSLIRLSRNPPERQLRQFGYCALVALPLIAWMLLGCARPESWTPGDQVLMGCFAGVGGLFAALGLAWPAGLRPMFLAASVITIPIGIVFGEVLLFVIYFLIFTPVALVFRLIGRDVLQRRFEPAATTYWIARAQPADPLQYYRQS